MTGSPSAKKRKEKENDNQSAQSLIWKIKNDTKQTISNAGNKLDMP